MSQNNKNTEHATEQTVHIRYKQDALLQWECCYISVYTVVILITVNNVTTLCVPQKCFMSNLC
jgi:hypothetical protein